MGGCKGFRRTGANGCSAGDRRGSAAARGGFTLVELLVVMAVIGVLVGMLLPAVQAARESARRTQCVNNLKQLGLALHNYHAAHRQFPSAYISQTGGGGLHGAPDPYTRDAGPGWAWGALLLPFLEQTTVGDTFDMRLPCWHVENASPAVTVLPVFLCPSSGGSVGPFDLVDDAGTRLAHFARSHYVTNAGRNEPWAYAQDDYSGIADGPFYRNSGTRVADVTDGLSNTVFLGEHHARLSHKTWVGVVPGAVVCPAPEFAFGGCDLAATLVQVHSGPAPSEVPPVIHPPNSPVCHVCQMFADHPGGCNVLLGDGSVRFVSAYIHQPTWAALATRAGGEVIGEY